MKKPSFLKFIVVVLFCFAFIFPNISTAVFLEEGRDLIYLYEHGKRIHDDETSILAYRQEETCEGGLCIILDNIRSEMVTIHRTKEDYSVSFHLPPPEVIETISVRPGEVGGGYIFEDRAFVLNLSTDEYMRIPLEGITVDLIGEEYTFIPLGTEPAENFHENIPYKKGLWKKILTTENIIYIVVLLLVLLVAIVYVSKKRKTVNK